MRASFCVPIAAVVCWLTAPSTGAAPLGDCPNVRATQVDLRVETHGETQRCGIGIRILGLGGGILGPLCHDRVVTYPSHQECRGESSPGTYCMPTGVMQVDAKECHCARATIFGTGLLFPSCSCQNTDDGGHVEDAATMPCRIILDPREL